MSEEQSFLEQLPQAAVEVRDGKITALNSAALSHLPELAVGDQPPQYLAAPLDSAQTAGAFTGGGGLFVFSKVSSPGGVLLLFRPAPDSALSPQQMDGFARQLREQMGGLLNNLQLLSQDLSGTGSPTDRRLASINRNFYQMLRLVNNLEFLRDTKSQSGVAFSPVTMDLAGLCRHTAEDTAPLLAQAGIQLRYQPSTEGLLIPGDEALLSRMLLGLLSNAAKAAPSGTVLLTLRRWGDRAVLTCTNTGSTPDDGQLSALLEGASPHLLPEPGEGAGMGLPIIRHIVALHGGTLLLERREPGGLAATVSLPTGPLSMDLTLSTPAPERSGGLSPLLVELSDVLPSSLYQPEDIE